MTHLVHDAGGSGKVVFVRFRKDGDAEGERTLEGREAWALYELHKAGASGVTPIDVPGPRWSGYVLKLRKRGLSIETVNEMHSGPFAGRHARYVLKTPVVVIETREAA